MVHIRQRHTARSIASSPTISDSPEPPVWAELRGERHPITDEMATLSILENRRGGTLDTAELSLKSSIAYCLELLF